MKKILITGASGFIGKEAVNYLSTKYKILTLDRNKDPLDDVDKIKKVISNVDCVVHLSGLTKGDSTELLTANLLGTMRLLQSISELKNKKPSLIFSSSFAVYAIGNKKLNEKSKILPRNIYGFSKLWAEEIIRYYSDNFDISTIILRFSNVYGPSMLPDKHSVVATFVDKIKNNQKIFINGDGNQIRDFIYIEDVIDAIDKSITLSMVKKIKETINVCSGEETSIKDIIKIIEKALKKSSIFSLDKKNMESGYWVGSNVKAKNILHWSPKLSFNEGMKTYLDEK